MALRVRDATSNITAQPGELSGDCALMSVWHAAAGGQYGGPTVYAATLVESGQRPGARATGYAATASAVAGHPATVVVQARATVRDRRMVSTYSTSEISTCLVDSRLRASHATTGTSLEIASASRTSCGL